MNVREKIAAKFYDNVERDALIRHTKAGELNSSLAAKQDAMTQLKVDLEEEHGFDKNTKLDRFKLDLLFTMAVEWRGRPKPKTKFAVPDEIFLKIADRYAELAELLK